MTIGFRSIFHVDRRSDPLNVVQAQVKSWLVEKRYPEDLSFEAGKVKRRDSKSAFLCVESVESSRSDWLGVLVEENNHKTWKVSVGVHDTGKPGSNIQVLIEVDVSPADIETAIDLVETPRFAKRLLETLEVTDGAVPILPGVGEIRTGEQLKSLVQNIEDRDRRISISVAPSPESQLDNEWMDIISQLTSRGTGNSSAYLLDANLTTTFNSLVSNDFGVGPGTVRTYVPGVDLSDLSNAPMHRFLTPMKLAKSIFMKNRTWKVSRPLQSAFNMASRLQYMQVEIPGTISSTWDSLVKKSEQIWLEERLLAKVKVHPAPKSLLEQDLENQENESLEIQVAIDVQPTLWRRLKKFLSRFTGTDSLSDESLTSLEEFLERQLQNIEQAEILMYEADEKRATAVRNAEDLRKSLNTQQAESSIDGHRIRFLEGENKRLRSGIAVAKAGSSAKNFDFSNLQDVFFCEDIAANLQEGGPQEFKELREYVVFTGDLKATKELDVLAQRQTYASIIIDYIEVLYDYARTKETKLKLSGGVDFYLKNPNLHDGRTTGPLNHSTESKSTQQEFGELRLFPVPEAVKKERFVAMWSHFKIAQSDTVAPRLHYFDDTSNTGKIYIGYIGRHLKNTLTN